MLIGDLKGMREPGTEIPGEEDTAGAKALRQGCTWNLEEGEEKDEVVGWDLRGFGALLLCSSVARTTQNTSPQVCSPHLQFDHP